MQIVLAPWEWDAAEACWIKPGGDYAGGCIDLRTLAQAAAPGPVPAGLGLFAYDDLPPGLDVAAHLGDDPLARLEFWRRNALADALGIDRRDMADGTLAEILAEQVLGEYADPAGALRTKPLRMSARGARLRLKGFGVIWRYRVESAHPVYAKTLEVRRLDYERNRTLLLQRAARSGVDPDAALDVLRRWNDFDAVALGADVDELVPERFRGDGRAPHATTLTESWPTDSSTISSGQDQPWNEDSGDTEVSSGALQPSVTEEQMWGRCTSDLSSDDHYHEATGTLTSDTGHHRASVTARKIDSTTDTCYEQRLRRDNSSALNKRVSGTPTSLDSTIGAQAAGSYALRLEADGSSITGEVDAGTNGPVTDTDITGNLQCGYLFFARDTGIPTLDAHTMADLSAGGIIPQVMHHRRLLGVS